MKIIQQQGTVQPRRRSLLFICMAMKSARMQGGPPAMEPPADPLRRCRSILGGLDLLDHAADRALYGARLKRHRDAGIVQEVEIPLVPPALHSFR